MWCFISFEIIIFDGFVRKLVDCFAVLAALDEGQEDILSNLSKVTGDGGGVVTTAPCSIDYCTVPQN